MFSFVDTTLNISTEFWTDLEYQTENVTQTMIITDNEEPNTFYMTRFVFTTIFVVLIIIANIVSLLAFVIEKRLRTYNNYFIINLSILDLLVGVGLSTQVQHVYLNRFPYSQNMCRILTAISTGIFHASNLSVVVICFDRHQAVYDPINHFISRTTRKAIIINSLPWVIGLSFWFGVVAVWEFVSDFDNGPGCIHQYSIHLWSNILHKVLIFYLPLLIIAVLYFRIVIKIRKSRWGKNVVKKSMGAELSSNSRVSTIPNGDSPASFPGRSVETMTEKHGDTAVVLSLPDEATVKTSGKELQIKPRVESTADMKKATRTLFFLVVIFVTTWISYSVITLMAVIAPRLVLAGLPVDVWIVLSLMVYGNSLLNPISYAVSQPLFRATVIRMFSCKRT